MNEHSELSRQQDSPSPAPRLEQAVGRVATLILVPSAVAVPLGPAWAVLSGLIAARHWRWEGNVLLSLIITAFVSEVLWSSWRAQLVDANWSEFRRLHPLPARGDPMPLPPYAKPDSPVGRLLTHVGRIRLWMREELPDERRGMLIATLVLPPLILLLSALVSVQMLILSAAALSIVILEWRAAERERNHDALRASLEIGLSWLAGHLVMAPLTPVSLILACCYAMAYQGILSVQHLRSPDQPARVPSLALLLSGQMAAGLVVLLSGKRAPLISTAALGFLIAPQLLLLAGTSQRGQGHAYARRVAPFLMLAMPIAAWAS